MSFGLGFGRIEQTLNCIFGFVDCPLDNMLIMDPFQGLRKGHPDVKGETMWSGLPKEGMIFDAAARSGEQPVLPISSNSPGDGSLPMRRAIFIELCAGSAKLSAACATKGMTALSIDHSSNRHRTRHHVMNLDLSDAHSWDVLRDVCKNRKIIWYILHLPAVLPVEHVSDS